MNFIDLNCDMGESFGAWPMGMDEKVMDHISSANIACGWHAGDPSVMEKTVRLAVENRVGIGAHPGYPDLLGFGRRNMACTPEEVRQYILYQVGALGAFCRVHKTRLQHVKPHGALYLEAVENEATARAIAMAIMDLDPSLYFVALAGKKGETMRRMGEEVGLKVVYEAFPDRAYTPEGTLVSRKLPGAVISDPGTVAQRALDMARGFVTAVDGSTIALYVQTLCVHGDNLEAVNLVRTIKQVLGANDIQVRPMGEKS
ncbi:MAG: 5-oxoprolinase subunit PxpA [Proteobacteria bacterium]|nr:5-oxoprolinase subunit PxpA [Desulfobacula sp.]MBU3952209.1 5-oxoprolinase subunit PxpA [Pseudomonadota bacterium]MBU4132678.1 5-oxoprolinase subunit PxpA [Pseudomonadota bacterium]